MSRFTNTGSRRRLWFFAAMAAIFVAGAFAAFWRAREEEPRMPPDLDQADASPRLVDALRQARDRVRRQPRSGLAWGNLGMLYMAHSCKPAAEQCFVAAAQFDPNAFRWHYYLGTLYEEHDLPLAEREYETAAGLASDYAPLRYRHGLVAMRLNRLDEARAEFQAAHECDPQSPYPLLGLGRVAAAHGDLAQARRHLNAACAAADWSREAHLELERVLYRQGDHAAAWREREKALTLPDAPHEMPDPVLNETAELDYTSRPLAIQADQCLARGDLPTAARLLRALVSQRPELSRPRLNLGQVLQNLGDLSGAAAVLHEAVEKFPEEPFAHYSLGRVEESLGLPEKAIESYRVACEFKPDYVEANYQLARLLRQDQRPADAAAVLRRAVSSEPGFVPGHLELAECLVELGDRAGALRHLQAVLRLAPQQPEFKKRIQLLVLATGEDR
jgi:tetratricopeptide (TPR) repeat protein